MNKYSILDDFYNRTLENYINNNLVYYDYKFPKDDVLHYVDELLEINIEEFLNWIDKDFDLIEISSNDMVQFSSFNDVLNIHNLLSKSGDQGVAYLEAGKLLLNDGKERTKLAYQKYGENHLKTSEYIGYLFSLDHVYYCSCLGYANEYISDDKKKKLLVRLILRTNLFKIVYMLHKNRNVDLRKVFDMLSDSTYKRRISNVRKIFDILNNSNEYDFSIILNKIVY